jgi:hypothetical protein
MEFLLLWVDELDDALAVLRHLAPRLLGLVAAFGLFAATGFALSRAPQAMLFVLAVCLGGGLFEKVRRRRAQSTASRQY